MRLGFSARAVHDRSSLAKLWIEWGFRPQVMIGHSIGEYVAACLAGVFSLEDGLALVAERGRLMQSLPTGAMLSVPLSEPDLLANFGIELDIAAINDHNSCVVSGCESAIEGFQRRLMERGIEGRRLHTSHAFHSCMMEPILDTFFGIVSSLNLHQPNIPYISNVSGDWIRPEEAMDARYWVRHLRQTVRFADGIGRVLLENPKCALLEVGPGQTLATFARRHPSKSADTTVLNSVRHFHEQRSDGRGILNVPE